MAGPRGHLVGWTLVAAILLAVLVSPGAATSSSVLVGVRHNMRANVITPDGHGPYPGVLVLHTAGGLEPADLDYAQRLAREGYVCLVPAFMEAYRISGPSRDADIVAHASELYADFVDALAVLRRNEKVGGSRVGAVGFSAGGGFATWLAATSKIQAGVSYYGGFRPGTDLSLSQMQAAFTSTSAPVLILQGSADAPATVRVAERLRAILDRAHSPYEIYFYPGAGHTFERELASKANRDAAEDSWRRTLEFLGKYLKQP
ncbi:MAG TPA: dienelactone hydrolase family protein [bacterium]|nr:dienelactone hydrolase family protein [bacterium]